MKYRIATNLVSNACPRFKTEVKERGDSTMEVLTDTNSAISHRRRLTFIKYDSPAFRDQPSSETEVKRTLREQCNTLFPGNKAKLNDPRSKDDVLSYNVCYARIWRGSGLRDLRGEEDLEGDSEMMNKAFPFYLEKDLDKLQKLRLKSRFKSRKCLGNNEVKAWIETPGKFIEILTELRKGKSKDYLENGSGKKTEASKSASAVKGQVKEPSHAVHFPQHVLLCAALQEGDPDEIEEVITNYSIDLNSLSGATGYYYLHKTIINDQLQCARILIQNRIDVNTKDSEGVSPLALAFRMNNFPMVALLVHSGACVGEYTDSRIQEMKKVKELSCSVSKVFEMDV